MTIAALGQVEIANRADLEAIDLTGHSILTADIDLSQAPWVPLGTFTGTLDGRGHTISGLEVIVPDGDDLGLFSTANGATFLRLHISGVVSGVQLGDRLGLLLGNGVNVLIRDVHADGDVRGRYNMGTLVGDLIASTVLDCSGVGSVGDGTSFTYGHTGGLIGTMTIGEIERCSFSGLVSTRYGPVMGALVGTIYGSAAVRDCHAHGCVVDHYGEPSESVSALIGSATEAEITRCYTTA